MSDEQPTSAADKYGAHQIEVLETPETFFGLLAAIRTRPGFYLYRKSVQHIWTFLWGYWTARQQAGLGRLPDEAGFQGFDFFVLEKYGGSGAEGWATKIARHCKDDEQSFDQFFTLLDEFRAPPRSKPKPIKRRKRE